MNLKKRVESRGWSMQGVSPHTGAPRNCARWNDNEQSDLAIAFAEGASVSRMAELLGRTKEGVLCRLGQMGLADYAPGQPTEKYVMLTRPVLTALQDAKFEFPRNCPALKHVIETEFGLTPSPTPVHHNCRSVFAPVTSGVSTMKLTANRLMTLLAIYRGTLHEEHMGVTYPADISFLQMNGLIVGASSLTPPGFKTSEAGRALVVHLLDKSDMPTPSKTSTTYSAERSTHVLDDGTFFMVTNGDVRGGANGLSAVKNPPNVIQPSQPVAEAEAVRLAKLHPEQKFFVLKAVSVHQTTTPVASTRL